MPEGLTRAGPAAAARLPSSRPSVGCWAAVLFGGFLGTELRYLLTLISSESAPASPETVPGFPLITLITNLAGSFALGWLTARWQLRPGQYWLRAGLGPGLLGSFTTFSAVVIVVDSLSQNGSWLVAAGYLLLSLSLGVATAAAGLHSGRGRSPSARERKVRQAKRQKTRKQETREQEAGRA